MLEPSPPPCVSALALRFCRFYRVFQAFRAVRLDLLSGYLSNAPLVLSDRVADDVRLELPAVTLHDREGVLH